MREHHHTQDSVHGPSFQTRRPWTRPIGWLVGATLLCAPMPLVAPTPANAHETAVEGARVATADLAVTERALEEVSAPQGYSDGGEKDATEVRADEVQLQASSDETATGIEREDISLARALVSSPTAILGVTFPLQNADDTVTISYRQRLGEQWSEWKQMELADAGAAPEYAQTTTLGTEPVPLTDADEVEVAVRTAEGQSLPGAQLTLIEPELSTDELAAVQVETHGEHAVEAVESLVDDIMTNEAAALSSAPNHPSTQSPVPAEDNANTATDASQTPAEVAEQNATLDVPAGASLGGQGIGGALGTIRAVGTTPDGRSYVTEVPGLTITTRKGWGADERVMDWTPEKTTFKGAVVHHTAGSNNYTKAQVPGIVQGVYRYHAVTLGWGDVGYHLLVDKFGGVWEGRAGGLTNSVVGGHALGANSTTFGISVLGDYMHVRPTDEALDAVAKAVAWKLKVHGIANLDASFTTKGKQWGKSSIQLPIVSAHRHVGGTSCPGDAFMTRWDELVAKVRSHAKQGKPSKPAEKPLPRSAPAPQWVARQTIGTGWNVGQVLAAGAFSGPGRTDAMLIDSAARLWLYPGVDHSSFPYSRKQIGTGWHILDQISAGVDFDGDGHPDVIGRLRSNGDLRLYSGDGRGGFNAMRRIGTEWNMFTTIHVVAGAVDGKPAVYGVLPNGSMRVYGTDGKGRFVRVGNVGTGWNTMRSLNSVGNKTGDRQTDIVAIDNAGRMWLYEGNGYAGFKGRVQIGQGWQPFTPVLSSGHNGILWTVGPDARLYKYSFNGMK